MNGEPDSPLGHTSADDIDRNRRLFKSLNFDLVLVGSALGTFPLYVAPFFIPMYTKSLGFSSNVGASLVAGFSLASAFGRIGSGIACDKLGSLNTLLVSFAMTAITMLAVWPASTTLGPLIVFVVINGAANGAFFSTMPTVVSNIFGSVRVAVVMSMVLTAWIGGYLMVSSRRRVHAVCRYDVLDDAG